MIVKRPTSGPASRFEWRTAPLWGFRDSGPYLHDGRADTIDQAVALHGGEATTIASKYFSLSPRERRQVEAFLKSLTAPEPVAPSRSPVPGERLSKKPAGWVGETHQEEAADTSGSPPDKGRMPFPQF